MYRLVVSNQPRRAIIDVTATQGSVCSLADYESANRSKISVLFFSVCPFKIHQNEIFVSSLICPIYSFKRAYKDGEFFFCRIVTESAVFRCRSRLFRAKLCPCLELVTSPIFTYEALKMLLFSLDLLQFILHIVDTN